ncbi:MAG TPA: glycosyltransferase family 39 protein [Thermomicrobiales bacterium]|nr:glycosyltransferase family 39 protein [Thermomicrobiales bacterium]
MSEGVPGTDGGNQTTGAERHVHEAVSAGHSPYPRRPRWTSLNTLSPSTVKTRTVLATARAQRQSSWSAIALIIGAAAIVLAQLVMISDRSHATGIGFLIYAFGVVLIGLAGWSRLWSYAGGVPAADTRATDRTSPAWLIGLGIASTAIAIGRAWHRGTNQSVNDIVVYWFAAIAFFVIAACWGMWEGKRITLPLRITFRTPAVTWPLIAGCAILIVAAFARLWELDRFTTIHDSDQGYYSIQARAFRDGKIANPFHLFFFTVPQLYVAVEGWLSRPFAESWAIYRVPSAVLGIVSVYATWRIGRRLLGDGIALMGAAILAVMPLNLWASRVSQNNIVDCAALALGILFIDRAIAHRSRLSALVCGLILGFAMYGYYGSRIFLPIIFVCLVAAIILPGSRLPILEAIRLAGWSALGFVSAAAPIIAHYLDHPRDFTARIDAVTKAKGHGPTLLDRAEDIGKALIYPMLDEGRGNYMTGFWRGLNPMLGWALAPFIAIGGVTWIVWLIREWIHPRRERPRPAFLLIAWGVICTGVAQTPDMQSQRFLAVTWVWALAAATGIAVIGMAIQRLMPEPVPIPWMRVAGGVAVAAIAIWHAQFFFNEDRQIGAYGDVRSMATYDLGWRFHQLDSSSYPRVIIASPSKFTYSGFGNWIFDAPALGPLVTNVPLDIDLIANPPVLEPGELIVISPELPKAQICSVANRNPTATVGEGFNRAGTLLYIVFSSSTDLILPTNTSPGGTVLRAIDTLDCQEPQS